MSGVVRPMMQGLEFHRESALLRRCIMTKLPRREGQSNRVAFGRLPAGLALCCVLAAMSSLWGCGGSRTVPTGDAAENIRKLALGYVQFAAANQGIGPSNQDVLKKFLMQRSGLTEQEAEATFTSPRDQQRYEIFWGQRPMGTRPSGHDPPKPAVIVVEAAGAGGTRYIADGQLSIKELPESEVIQMLPKSKPQQE